MKNRKHEKLFIVESPSKAKSLKGTLDRMPELKGSRVIATMGHVSNLPERSADIPEEYRAKAWARLGINTEQGADYEMLRVPNTKGSANIAKIREAAASAQVVYMATDPDREGTGIASEVQRMAEIEPQKLTRIELRELTPEGIREAIRRGGPIDRQMVEAQMARRSIDRIYGWELSPTMAKRLGGNVSAGRVQTTAASMMVDREIERAAFKPLPVSRIEAEIEWRGKRLSAHAVALDGQKIANHHDHDPISGRHLRGARLSEPEVQAIGQALPEASMQVTAEHVESFTIAAPEPFTTASLLQRLGEELGMSTRQASQAIQQLYELSLITYMRTDSSDLSENSVEAIRGALRAAFGDAAEHLIDHSKSGREIEGAHEGIRPAGDRIRPPAEVQGMLTEDQFRAYELIYREALASQLGDLHGERRITELTASIEISGRSHQLTLMAAEESITEPGFQRMHGGEAGQTWSMGPEEQERGSNMLRERINQRARS